MPSNIDISLLNRAVEENGNIMIRRVGDSGEANYYSRFLGAQPGDDTLLVDFPVASARRLTLKKGDGIEVYFSYRNFRLVFSSTIRGRTRHAIRRGRELPALVIDFPKFIEDGERRQFFRVPTPPLPVTLGLDPREGEYCGDFAAVTYSCVAYEIAGGGIGLREEEERLPLETGDRVALKVHLPEVTLCMRAVVRYHKSIKESGTRLFGLEFDPEKMDPLRFNRNIHRIMRFVMKRQREIIQ